eukprot:3415091-Rhodomonas_salina.2
MAATSALNEDGLPKTLQRRGMRVPSMHWMTAPAPIHPVTLPSQAASTCWVSAYMIPSCRLDQYF